MANADDPWAALQKNFVIFSKKLDLNDTFVRILYQEEFLERQQCDSLLSNSGSSGPDSAKERAAVIDRLLLEKLPCQSSTRFGDFCNCLRKSGQEHLANILEHGEEGTYACLNTVRA